MMCNSLELLSNSLVYESQVLPVPVGSTKWQYNSLELLSNSLVYESQVLPVPVGSTKWLCSSLELEQLERLRSEDTPHRLMITHTIESYRIPSQKKAKSKLQI